MPYYDKKEKVKAKQKNCIKLKPSFQLNFNERRCKQSISGCVLVLNILEGFLCASNEIV